MFALPETLYLWKPESALGAEPDFTASAKPLLLEYLGPKLAEQAGGPLGESLELAIKAWLSDLARGIRKPEQDSEADQMLVSAGLYERMKGALVTHSPHA